MMQTPPLKSRSGTPKKGEYEKSTHYQVVRREDGKYTVHLIGDAFFEGWEGKQGVLYYHQANQGKYRIVELKAPASYNLKAWEHNNWVIGWSEEIIVHPDYPTYEFLGETASRNMPYKQKSSLRKSMMPPANLSCRTRPGHCTSGMSGITNMRSAPTTKSCAAKMVLHCNHTAQRLDTLRRRIPLLRGHTDGLPG